VHVLDFWVGAAAGCSIVVAPSQQLKDVEAVAALIQQHSVVSTSFVPSICQPLLEACGGKPLLSSLRHVSIGGEAVRPAAVAAMLTAAPHTALYNIYGAWRCSVASCTPVMTAACMCKVRHVSSGGERVLCMCRAH
jgi:non-ribosomal peptide synthetase component F